jgi:hypothetical protein
MDTRTDGTGVLFVKTFKCKLKIVIGCFTTIPEIFQIDNTGMDMSWLNTTLLSFRSLKYSCSLRF